MHNPCRLSSGRRFWFNIGTISRMLFLVLLVFAIPATLSADERRGVITLIPTDVLASKALPEIVKTASGQAEIAAGQAEIAAGQFAKGFAKESIQILLRFQRVPSSPSKGYGRSPQPRCKRVCECAADHQRGQVLLMMPR